MSKRRPVVRKRSHGVYSTWDSEAKELPRFIEVADQIPARIDIEFGMVVNIMHGKNCLLEYRIKHPGILDDAGRIRPAFDGELYVKSNDWDFYLGDTIWSPIDDKLGIWEMSIQLDGVLVAEQAFEVYQDDQEVAIDVESSHGIISHALRTRRYQYQLMRLSLR